MSRHRFTDADKWDDPWVMELDAPMKLLWFYLCDSCDHAGVWKVNKRLAEFKIGMPINWDAVALVMGGRVFLLGDGARWFLPKFLRFQNPNGLKVSCPAHAQVVRMLHQHKIDRTDHRWADILAGLLANFIAAGLADASPVSTSPSGEERAVGGGMGVPPLWDPSPIGKKNKNKTQPSSFLEGDARGSVSDAAFRDCTKRTLSLLGIRRPTATQMEEWIEYLAGDVGAGTCEEAQGFLTWVFNLAKSKGKEMIYARNSGEGGARDWRENHQQAFRQRNAKATA